MWRGVNKYWPVNLIIGVLLVNGAALVSSPDWKGFYENTKDLLVFCSAFLVCGSLLTALFCRYRIRHRQRMSYLTVFLAGAVATVCTMISGFLVVYGQRLFTTDFWLALWQFRIPWIGLCLLAFLMSVLAALAVVIYYRRQQQDYACTL